MSVGAVAASHKKTRFEYLGSNTLAPFADVYARNTGEGKNDPRWIAFKEDSRIFKRLFKNLRDPDSTASKDLDEWVAELSESGEADHQKSATKLKQAVARYRGNQDADAKAFLMTTFENALDARKAVLKKKTADSFTARRKLQKEPLKEYASNVIARNMKSFMKRKNIPETDVDDMDAFLKAARKRYRDSDKSESDFADLEQAYAMDYSARHLDDLIGSKKPAKNKKALDILEGTDIRGDSKDPMVYMGKKAFGKLRLLSGGAIEVRGVIEKGQEKVFSTTAATEHLEQKMADLPFIQDKTVKITTDDAIEEWTPPTLSRRKTISMSMRHRMKSSRSMSLRRSSSIIDSIKRVMSQSNLFGVQRRLSKQESVGVSSSKQPK